MLEYRYDTQLLIEGEDLDEDVMQHCLYNPLFEVSEQEKIRYEKLKVEFNVQ